MLKALILLSIFLSIPSLHAQEVFIVRGDGNYAPYEMMKDGTLVGLHIELIQNTAKRLNWNLHIDSYPWARALNMMKTGEADGILFVGRNEEREQYIIFNTGNIISQSYSALLVLKKRLSEFRFDGKNINSLKPFIFGQQIDYIYGDLYDQAKLDKVNFNSYAQLFGMLHLERIDIAMMNLGEFRIKQKSNMKFVDEIQPLKHLVKQNNYIGFSKARNRQNFANEFSSALTRFKSSKEFQALINKYNLDR